MPHADSYYRRLSPPRSPRRRSPMRRSRSRSRSRSSRDRYYKRRSRPDDYNSQRQNQNQRQNYNNRSNEFYSSSYRNGTDRRRAQIDDDDDDRLRRRRRSSRDYSSSNNRRRSSVNRRRDDDGGYVSPTRRSEEESQLDQCRIHVADLAESIEEPEAKNPPCFAFVVFERKEDAAQAVDEMDQKLIGNSRVRVSFARPRTRGRQRRWDPSMKCYQCGERGHFSRDCKGPSADYSSQSQSKRNRSRSQSRGGRSRSRSNNNNNNNNRSRSRSRPASRKTIGARCSPNSIH